MICRTRSLCVWAALTIALLIIGAVLVRNATAVPATNWMLMYRPSDFPTTHDLVIFLKELRVPIPPVVAALEVVSFQRTGSTDLVSKYLYRASLVGTYVLALWFAYPSIPRLIASFLTSLIFLWATTLVHPLNPQIYDILFPCFIFLFLACVQAASARPATRAAIVVSMCAGFFLSMAELDRPFVLLFVPFLLAGAYGDLRHCARHAFAALLIPVGLFSGIWHAHLFAVHHQVLSTNYSGFNLRRAWPQAPLDASVSESHSHPRTERWPNLNTEEQQRQSQTLQRAVLAYLLANPREVLPAAVRKIVRFIRAPISMYGRVAPPHPILAVYRLAAPAAFALLFGNLVVLAVYAMTSGGRFHLLLGNPENLLVLVAGLSVLVLSLSEAKEEARLVLTVLPFLAACPMARRVSDG